MALILVGTGVAFDLTIAGIQALRECDEAYIETYTGMGEESLIEGLEGRIGKKIARLKRGEVESPFLVEKASSVDVCLLSSGDPLTATTHVSLVVDARQKGIPVRVIHNSSIYSVAPARSGLQVYRFGKTASLVNPRPNYKPTSSLDVIKKNLKMDMHTLVLLDTEPEPMDAKTALGMLSDFDTAIVLSRVGHGDERISYGKPENLKEQDLGSPPFTVIIPATLHPMEKEFLETLKR
jgi:diphthine synthase